MRFGVRAVITLSWRLGLLMLLATGATGCSGLAMFSERMFMMTPEQEMAFGTQVAQEVARKAQMVNDPLVVNYVRGVGKRVVDNSPPSELPIRFFVVKDDSINAFAIPGGNIYVNTGLIKAADDESELASVLAHEVGHVVRRHAARQLSHTESLTAVQQILTGNNSSQTSQLLTSLLNKGVMFNFSREDEFEADSIAVRTLARSGYDPQAMKRLFNKLLRAYGDNVPQNTLWAKVQQYASTHPSTRERIANVEQVMRDLPVQPPPQPNTTELRRVQGRLKQLNLIN